MVSFPRLQISALITTALLPFLLPGCASPPADAIAAPPSTRDSPVNMTGHADYFAGKLSATVTVNRGPGKKPEDPNAPPDQRATRTGGGRSRRDGSAAMEPPTGERDQGSARGRTVAGSPLPTLTLRLKLENRGTQSLAMEIIEVSSELGNFAVRPAKLEIPAGETLEPDPMFSKLGITSDPILVKVVLRLAGAREDQTIAVESVRAPAVSPLSR